MKVFGRVVFAFLVSIFLAIALPSLSLSAYQWEPCGTGSPPVNQCVTKGVADGLTETYRCHKSAISGNWQWDKQTLLQTGGSESIESNKIIPGICSDGFNNNCNGITVLKPAGVYDSPLSNSIDYDTNDCVAPTTSITSVASDTSAPYYDTNGGDSKTDIVVSGESGMACKWDTTSHDYSDDFGTLCTPSGSSATCSVNDANTEDAKTRYVACKDSNANVQSLSDPATSRYPITVNWINDWSGPAITFDATNPKDPTGVPYDIKFKVKDLYSGVKDHAEADDITLEIKKGAGIYYSLTYTLPGFCNNAGEECSITKTINSGDAEAADGTYTIKVTAKDKLGNVNSATRSFSVSTCKLDSVSIAPSTACTKNLNSCSVSNPGDNACEKGNAIDVTARYTGLSCPTTFTVQVDAKSAEIPVASCNVQGSGGQMTGISITCSNTPSASQQTCTGTWTLPDPIPSACQQETITAKSGSSDACINGIYCTAPSGSFGACKDITVPSVSIVLNSGSDYTASTTVTATSLSGEDSTYGLNSCTINWGDATTTKTCGGAAGEECASLFSAAEKQHLYASDGSKTAAFSCTNNNGIIGTSSDSLSICTSIGSATNLLAYSDSSPSKTTLPNGAWQKDNTPYFEWSAVTSLCGVRYDVQIDSNPVTTITINSYTLGAMTNGKHTITVTPKDNTGLGLAGGSATFNLWVDISAPTTSITEAIPAWFTSAPTLHLSCSDNPAAPADNSGCGTVQFCTGNLCTPITNYDAASGIPIASGTVLGYRSADSAGNTETAKYTTINVDATAPSVVSVTDSGAFTKSTAALTAAWTVSVDAESGISLYQYAVGTTSGGTDVIGFTDTGATTTATISGLGLINGNTYYITIRAKNGAGLFGTPASSDGIKVDTDGPGGVETIKIERTFGNYISGTYAIFTDAISDTAGVDTTTCSYTIDDAIWPPAAWNTTDKSCKKVGLSCTDGQQIKVKMRISDVLGTTSQTSASVIKTCDTTWPELQSFVPAAGTTLSTALKDLTFSTTARDLKSGLAKLEWTLFKNDVAVNTIQKACDGGESVSVTCDFKTSEFVDPGTVKTGDKFFVRVRGDDHIDPWSPTGDSGQWSVDETAPAISAITPTLATLSVQQDYSAGVKATGGRTISSCDLLVNGAKIDDMALTSGTGADGTWTGQYTITAPSTIFMRAHCVDDSAVAGDGLDVQISLATATTSVVAPSVVEKLQIASITANYKLTTGTAITGAKCWISSSDFNDPSKGIVGVTLTDLNNGYYTYSFAAPAISGNYNYAVSCAKPGYQTTSNSNMFTVQGCNGMVCIKVTPSNTVAILTLGEPQAINLILKNRDDFTRTYSVSLSNPDPKIFVDISPTQVTLANGEQKAVTVRLTSLAITDQQIVQNIIVKNIDPSKPSDIATSVINAAIAVSAVPGIGAVEVAAIFVLAAVIVYNRTGRKVKRKR